MSQTVVFHGIFVASHPCTFLSMLSKEQGAQVCDATKLNSFTKAWVKKIPVKIKPPFKKAIK